MTIQRSLRVSALALAALSMPIGIASAKTPAGFTEQDKADVTCMVAFAAIMDKMSSDPDTSQEDLSGMSSVITYFLGKVTGRHASTPISTILDPDFVISLSLDSEEEIKRCSVEAEKMGNDLAKAGEVLQNL